MVVHAYIRISKDTSDYQNQRHIIAQYCTAQNLPTPQYLEETVSGKTNHDDRQLATLIAKLRRDDVLICADVSRLGRNTMDVMEVGAKVMKAKAKLICVENDLELKDDIGSEITFFTLSLGARISREMISSKTKTALAAKRAEGIKLGRPVGSTHKKLQGDAVRQTVEGYLKKNLSRNSICKLLEVDRQTLRTYIERELPQWVKKKGSD